MQFMAIRRCIHRGLRPSASPLLPSHRLRTLHPQNPADNSSIATLTHLRQRNFNGYSHGHLISAAAQEAHIINVFTGEELRLPVIPPQERSCLSAPPSSSSSILFMVDKKWIAILYWRLNGVLNDSWFFTRNPLGLLPYGRVSVVDLNEENISLDVLDGTDIWWSAMENCYWYGWVAGFVG